jgi:hypothetical protein
MTPDDPTARKRVARAAAAFHVPRSARHASRDPRRAPRRGRARRRWPHGRVYSHSAEHPLGQLAPRRRPWRAVPPAIRGPDEGLETGALSHWDTSAELVAASRLAPVPALTSRTRQVPSMRQERPSGAPSAAVPPLPDRTKACALAPSSEASITHPAHTRRLLKECPSG